MHPTALTDPTPDHAGDGLRHDPAWLIGSLLWLGWALGSALARWPRGSATQVIAWQLAMASGVWLLWLIDRLVRPSALPLLPFHTVGHASLWRQLLGSAQAALWLLLPGVGWLALNAQGHAAHWLGLLPLPNLMSPDAALSEALAGVHAALAWFLGLLLFAQLLASIRHAPADTARST